MSRRPAASDALALPAPIEVRVSMSGFAYGLVQALFDILSDFRDEGLQDGVFLRWQNFIRLWWETYACGIGDAEIPRLSLSVPGATCAEEEEEKKFQPDEERRRCELVGQVTMHWCTGRHLHFRACAVCPQFVRQNGPPTTPLSPASQPRR